MEGEDYNSFLSIEFDIQVSASTTEGLAEFLSEILKLKLEKKFLHFQILLLRYHGGGDVTLLKKL